MERTKILFVCTESFRDALCSFAEKESCSASEIVRRAVAEYIGYDISKDPPCDLRRKYASVEDRKNAHSERQKLRRQEERKLVEAFEHEEHLRTLLVLSRSIERTGT